MLEGICISRGPKVLYWGQHLNSGEQASCMLPAVHCIRKHGHDRVHARQLCCVAETVAEEVCQGGAAADASDAHAAASSSDHESGIANAKDG